jgi:alpha-aminoadipic semialdehyde synthase
VYDPRTGDTSPGVSGPGIVVMAVDNLPCELPRDASDYFSATLARFAPSLAAADFSRPLAELGLPPEMQRAVIAHRGALTPEYRYLEEHLPEI